MSGRCTPTAERLLSGMDVGGTPYLAQLGEAPYSISIATSP